MEHQSKAPRGGVLHTAALIAKNAAKGAMFAPVAVLSGVAANDFRQYASQLPLGQAVKRTLGIWKPTLAKGVRAIPGASNFAGNGQAANYIKIAFLNKAKGPLGRQIKSHMQRMALAPLVGGVVLGAGYGLYKSVTESQQEVDMFMDNDSPHWRLHNTLLMERGGMHPERVIELAKKAPAIAKKVPGWTKHFARDAANKHFQGAAARKFLPRAATSPVRQPGFGEGKFRGGWSRGRPGSSTDPRTERYNSHGKWNRDVSESFMEAHVTEMIPRPPLPKSAAFFDAVSKGVKSKFTQHTAEHSHRLKKVLGALGHFKDVASGMVKTSEPHYVLHQVLEAERSEKKAAAPAPLSHTPSLMKFKAKEYLGLPPQVQDQLTPVWDAASETFAVHPQKYLQAHRDHNRKIGMVRRMAHGLGLTIAEPTGQKTTEAYAAVTGNLMEMIGLNLKNTAKYAATAKDEMVRSPILRSTGLRRSFEKLTGFHATNAYTRPHSWSQAMKRPVAMLPTHTPESARKSLKIYRDITKHGWGELGHNTTGIGIDPLQAHRYHYHEGIRRANARFRRGQQLGRVFSGRGQ